MRLIRVFVAIQEGPPGGRLALELVGSRLPLRTPEQGFGRAPAPGGGRWCRQPVSSPSESCQHTSPHPNPIPSDPIPTDPVPPQSAVSNVILSNPIPSRPVPSHPVPSRPTPNKRRLFCPNPFESTTHHHRSHAYLHTPTCTHPSPCSHLPALSSTSPPTSPILRQPALPSSIFAPPPSPLLH